MKDIILFCQAPADIQYALTIYERNKGLATISIFCINVEGMYAFIKSLKLDLEELVFIPYDFNFYYLKPAQIIKVKRKLNFLYRKYFYNIENKRIYFFSHFFDYMTFFFLSKLSLNNNINFIDHYDEAISKHYHRPHISLKLFIIKTSYKFITGINFDFYEFNNSFILEFPFYKWKILRIKDNILDMNIFLKYSYLVGSNNTNNILLLEGDYQTQKSFKDYEKYTKVVIQSLKDHNYELFLKPHPRLGYSKFLDDYIDSFVNADVPAEFIDESKFKVIIGVCSSALACFANRNNVKVISLLNFYQSKDQNTKHRAFKYLNDLSLNIIFIKDIAELIKEIQ